ncbi:MAG TPA: hypothetical protein VFW35_08005 [Sphingomicrobium sp.]|nr:hypothetical protein [Sphingomicrobium sp.]
MMSIATITRRWYDRKYGLGGAAGESQPFDQLTRYIPTESIALFVPTMSFIGAAAAPRQATNVSWIAYGLFIAVVTPGIVLLVALGKQKSAGQPFTFPTWPMLSACLAFAGWALAVPGLLTGPGWKIGAGVIALFISILLSLLEPLWE